MTGDESNLARDVGGVVALTLVAVAALDGVGSGIAAGIQHSDLSPGFDDYIEFANLWLATGLLSVTLTAAMAAWYAAPLLGFGRYWQVPLAILVVGAFLTGLPVKPEGGTRAGLAVGALRTFADYYGTAFFGGLIVGGASCVILGLVCDHVSTPSAK